LASGFERRVSAWSHGRRRFLIGAGIKAMSDAAELLAFYEAREGCLIGFRFRDFSDFKSCALDRNCAPTDQIIGKGDGVTRKFYLQKSYNQVKRSITKPEANTVVIALNGQPQTSGFSVDITKGEIDFWAAPDSDVIISAGYHFDTPVRFDSQTIDLTLEGFDAGRVGGVGLIEIRTDF
jgi:uncharacterized protein (TIGR02217 family)